MQNRMWTRMRHRLQDAPELLDDAFHDSATLGHSLDHVAQVNRLLGGERAVLHELTPLLQAKRAVRILDVGTGSADIPRAIAAAARRMSADVHIVASDIHAQIRMIAEQRCAAWPEIAVEEADALALPFADGSFDVALLSLTLHHLEGDQPVRALREAGRVARCVVVNELERGWPNYTGALVLGATWWRRNPLTRHDGTRSVLRSFTMPELRKLATDAGLRDVQVRRRWFFRLVLTATGRNP